MAASYPTAVKTFTYKIDNKDKVVAADVNTLYDEVNSIEAQLGVGALGVTTGYQGTFNNTKLDWGNLRDRIQNIEYGVGGLNSVIDGGSPTSA